MKILLCGRRRERQKIAIVYKHLKEDGYDVSMGALSLTNPHSPNFEETESFKEIKSRNMIKHFKEIEYVDAIIVCNFDGYIGMNTFAEIIIAWYKGKIVVLLNDYDHTAPFSEELYAVNPIVLNRGVQ